MTENPQLHDKLRLELIIERPVLRRAENLLESAGVLGWTVLPAMAGFGGNTRWSRGTDISGSSDMVVLISIGSAERITAALGPLHELIDRQIGMLSVSDAKVLRPGKF